MPRTDCFVSGTTSSSPISPANPRLIPRTSQPRLIAESTAARITALSPGASPPPVEIAIRMKAAADPTGGTPGEGGHGTESNDTMTPRVAAGSRSRGCFAEQTQDLAGPGVPAELRLLEDGHSVSRHLEAAATGGLHGDRRVGIAFTNRGRQTGGPRLVVSNGAVFDVDRHMSSRSGECPRANDCWHPREHRSTAARFVVAPTAMRTPSAVHVVCHRIAQGRMIPGGFGGSGIPWRFASTRIRLS